MRVIEAPSFRHRSLARDSANAATPLMPLRIEWEAVLERGYWLRRTREELAMAWSSTNAEAKLIHFDLAGRYSVRAAKSVDNFLPKVVLTQASRT